MNHPICQATIRALDNLETVADANPIYMSTSDKAEALTTIALIEARAAEMRLRVLVTAADVAEATGERDVAAWTANTLHTMSATARRELRLAKALDHLPSLAVALRDGLVCEEQAHAMVKALEMLPDDIPADMIASAETYLVRKCHMFDAKIIRETIGPKLLETIAPDIADELLLKKLQDEERRARETTRLTMRSNGDGTTSVSARMPDAAAGRLLTDLNAFTNPRKGFDEPTFKCAEHLKPWQDRVPYPRRAGQAFVQLLETLDSSRLPIHGGDATTLIITMILQDLRSDLAAATISAQVPGEATDRITSGEARRLACTANLIPAVLGTDSEILDVGRSQRLHTPAMRRAMLLRDKTCLSQGCDIPGQWCEAHHWTPWSHGGNTNLADGGLLCSHHHHLVHDDNYVHERFTNGQIGFHRRT